MMSRDYATWPALYLLPQNFQICNFHLSHQTYTYNRRLAHNSHQHHISIKTINHRLIVPNSLTFPINKLEKSNTSPVSANFTVRKHNVFPTSQKFRPINRQKEKTRRPCQCLRASSFLSCCACIHIKIPKTNHCRYHPPHHSSTTKLKITSNQMKNSFHIYIHLAKTITQNKFPNKK